MLFLKGGIRGKETNRTVLLDTNEVYLPFWSLLFFFLSAKYREMCNTNIEKDIGCSKLFVNLITIGTHLRFQPSS